MIRQDFGQSLSLYIIIPTTKILATYLSNKTVNIIYRSLVKKMSTFALKLYWPKQ